MSESTIALLTSFKLTSCAECGISFGLPADQQLKDHLFMAVVRALSPIAGRNLEEADGPADRS